MNVPNRSVIAAVALGSNVGDRHAHIEHAFDAMMRIPETSLVRRGPVIQTEPLTRAGVAPGGMYLNSAAILATRLGPHELLGALQATERERGRDRACEPRWGPRTLDLDLLTFGDRVIDEVGLTVPHPRMHERRFVLEPLAAIAPDLVVPGRVGGGTVRELLEALTAAAGA